MIYIILKVGVLQLNLIFMGTKQSLPEVEGAVLLDGPTELKTNVNPSKHSCHRRDRFQSLLVYLVQRP